MATEASSTSSSSPGAASRPGWGLLLALLILGLLRSVRPVGESVVRDDARLNPFSLDLSQVTGGGSPDLLLVGDSRFARMFWGEIAAGYGGTPPTGGLLGIGGCSTPVALSQLREAGLRPRVLVVGASAVSLGMLQFMRDHRQGAHPDLKAWTLLLEHWLKHRLVLALGGLPDKDGPGLVVEHLHGTPEQRRAASPPPDLFEGEAVLPNLRNYERGFHEQPLPSPEVVEESIREIRRFQEAGTKVVLVRLPVAKDMLELEDGWGCRRICAEVSRATGAPLIDMNLLPIGEEIRPSVLDSSHVFGAAPRKRLSREVGRLARETFYRSTN